MELKKVRSFQAVSGLAASCIVIFWPGVFIFGFPGVMAPYWQDVFSVGRDEIGLTLFFLLAAVGTFMFVSGRVLERVSPNRLVFFGSALCGATMLSFGCASSMNMVYLWAFLTGVSVSFILVPALTVAQQWFPLRRGFASGMVNMVFGLSAAVMSPIITQWMVSIGYQPLTRILGICALVTGFAAAPFLRLPQKVSIPVSTTESTALPSSRTTLRRTLKTASFWCIWLIWGTAGAAGIATVTLSTTFGVARGLSIEKAVLILTAFNITNGASRLIAGYLSDSIGRRLTMGLTFAAAGLGYWLLPYMTGLTWWIVAAAVVGFAFGTLFAVSAPLIVDCFGMERFGAVFGMVFTAYAFVAGPIGPWLSGWLLDRTSGNFAFVFGYLGTLCAISAVLIRFVTPSPVSNPRRGNP